MHPSARPDPGQVSFAAPPVTAGFDPLGNWHIPGGPEGGRFAKPGWSGAKAAAVHEIRGLLASERARDSRDGAVLALRPDTPADLLGRLGAPDRLVLAHWRDDRHAAVEVDGRQVLVPWTRFADPTPQPEFNDLVPGPGRTTLDYLTPGVIRWAHKLAAATEDPDDRRRREHALDLYSRQPEVYAHEVWSDVAERNTSRRWIEQTLVSPTPDPDAIEALQQAHRAAIRELGGPAQFKRTADGDNPFDVNSYGLDFALMRHGDDVLFEQDARVTSWFRTDGPFESSREEQTSFGDTPHEATFGPDRVLANIGDNATLGEYLIAENPRTIDRLMAGQFPIVDGAEFNDLPDRTFDWAPQPAFPVETVVAGTGRTDLGEAPIWKGQIADPGHPVIGYRGITSRDELSDPYTSTGWRSRGKAQAGAAEQGTAFSHTPDGLFGDKAVRSWGGAYGDQRYLTQLAVDLRGMWFTTLQAPNDDGSIPATRNLGLAVTGTVPFDRIVAVRTVRPAAAAKLAALDAERAEWLANVDELRDRLAKEAGYESWKKYSHARIVARMTDEPIDNAPDKAFNAQRKAMLDDTFARSLPIIDDPANWVEHVGPEAVAAWLARPSGTEFNDLPPERPLAGRMLDRGARLADEEQVSRDLVAALTMRLSDRVSTQADIDGYPGPTQAEAGGPLVHQWNVRGQFIDDKSGDEIGEFKYVFTADRDAGTTSVLLDSISLYPEWQGSGLGSQFTIAAENAYWAAGIDQITLHAQSWEGVDYDAGVYTWARAGFGWDLSTEDGRTFFSQTAPHLARDLERLPDPPDGLDPAKAEQVRADAKAAAVKLRQMIDDVNNRYLRAPRPDDITPSQIARLGRDQGWPVGKLAMSPYTNRSAPGAPERKLDFMYAKPSPATPEFNDLADRQLTISREGWLMAHGYDPALVDAYPHSTADEFTKAVNGEGRTGDRPIGRATAIGTTRGILAEAAADVRRDRLIIRVPRKVAEQIVADGRLKSRFETKTSRGASKSDLRITHETQAFGIPDGFDPASRPIYGLVATDATPATVGNNYGGIGFALSGAKVADRVTISVGDSLNSAEPLPLQAIPVATDDQIAAAAGWTGTGIVHDAIAGIPFDHYVEAQVHGGVTTGDIAAVYAFGDHQPTIDTAAAVAKKLGVPMRTAPRGETDGPELWKAYAPEFNDLPERPDAFRQALLHYQQGVSWGQPVYPELGAAVQAVTEGRPVPQTDPNPTFGYVGGQERLEADARAIVDGLAAESKPIAGTVWRGAQIRGHWANDRPPGQAQRFVHDPPPAVGAQFVAGMLSFTMSESKARTAAAVGVATASEHGSVAAAADQQILYRLDNPVGVPLPDYVGEREVVTAGQFTVTAVSRDPDGRWLVTLAQTPAAAPEYNDLPERDRIDRLVDEPVVAEITGAFHDAGRSIYLVGGAVRDALSGKEPNDIDLTTDALPEETKKLLDPIGAVYPLGEEHGTIVVNVAGEDYEVTTHRIERYDPGSRQPITEFTTDLTGDLARRDFTFNAMAVDPTTREVIDPFGGRTDLAAGVVRAVGNPDDRFSEDPLRIIRAVRFAAVNGWSIDPATADAARRQSDRLGIVSVERTTTELDKVLKAPRPTAASDAYRLATDLHAADRLFGPLTAAFTNPTPDGMVPIDKVPAPHRFAALVAAAGVEPHSLIASMKRGSAEMRRVTDVLTAARLIKGGQPAAALRRYPDDVIVTVEAITTYAKPMLAGFWVNREALRAPLPIDGNDVMALGFKGRDIRVALERAEAAFLAAGGRLSRDEALAAAR